MSCGKVLDGDGILFASPQKAGLMDPLVKYLVECSKESLRTFRMVQLNNRAEALKTLRESLKKAVEAQAEWLFAQWLEEYGEELVIALDSRTPQDSRDTTSQHRLPALLDSRRKK